MAKFNVSKREAKRLGIKRKKVGGGGGGKSGKVKFKKIKIPKIDTTRLRELESRALATLTPSEEELGAQRQLSNIATSRELGIAKTKEQPIESAFVTGQGAAITRRTALQAMPIETQLAQLQARRQAAQDVLSTTLGFEQAEVSRQSEAQRFAQERRLQQQQLQIQQQQFGSQQGFEREKLAEQARQFGIQESRLGRKAGAGPATSATTNPLLQGATQVASGLPDSFFKPGSAQNLLEFVG